MKDGLRFVDSDMHIMEPPDLFDRYLDPKFKDRISVPIGADGRPKRGAAGLTIIDGLPMWRNPMPWKNSTETPNIGTWAQTDDIRPGLGYTGVQALQAFVAKGDRAAAHRALEEALQNAQKIGTKDSRAHNVQRIAEEIKAIDKR